ncbi:acyl CoA:acetate/3-ketoacid CoA transferase [Variovorax sp. KK3]|uniref:acyl CoA:acetate/3-ketoacid CoA transferase n=1 Tax=Variovorax sp. KK3 TaxID=1855728 RepID=UPI00097C47D6|nr:CoA-transferase [Variovorax sp. KK3]
MRDKTMTAAQAAALIGNGATVAVTGSGGGLVEPDAVFEAIEKRFRNGEGAASLTLVHSLGLGDRNERGSNRFAHDGMVRRVIGGHWTWSPRMQALAKDNRLQAYALPGGVIAHLLREIGAGRPGLITHVGLGTFVDPRHGGGRMNAAAEEDVVELLQLDGKEYLRYKPFSVDVGIIRGTYADTAGNISLEEEPADLDGYAVALAAHNSGGKVIAQVREVVPAGTLNPRNVAIPGALVDAVVVVPAQMQTYRGSFDPSLVGRSGDFLKPPASTDPLKRIVARRAALELKPGDSLNFGFGASAQVASLIAERGDAADYWMTIEQGIHGGHMIDDDLFGMAHHPSVIIDSPSQFDFYSGGGLDMAFLGMAEMDGSGNVNVSKLNGNVNGPGGFIDISQNAGTVVFCGTFDAKGSQAKVENGRVEVQQHGRIRKLVRAVSHVTFSGQQALRRGQRVLYVTERATFELTPDGVELIELAPGIDLQRDVLSQMDFAPVVRAVRSYAPEVMQ